MLIFATKALGKIKDYVNLAVFPIQFEIKCIFKYEYFLLEFIEYFMKKYFRRKGVEKFMIKSKIVSFDIIKV